ncbi:hypothetical protein [Methylocella sp.]|uniref:hypothetical protein n=1 Tax=Methylocella sp. TaxID=1978226 RepID=UPI003C77692F
MLDLAHDPIRKARTFSGKIIFPALIFPLFRWLRFDDLSGLGVVEAANDLAVATEQADLINESVVPPAKFRPERFSLEMRRGLLNGAQRFAEAVGGDLVARFGRGKALVLLRRLRLCADAKAKATGEQERQDQKNHKTSLARRR